jgi:hypothetical protein
VKALRGRRAMGAAGLAVALISLVAVPAGESGAVPLKDTSAAGAETATSNAAFKATKTITRDNLVNGQRQVVDSRTVSVSVDQTSGLRDRQEINVQWSGAHPTGGLYVDPNAYEAAQEEYPVVVMECRGLDSTTAPVADQIAPDTCWTQTSLERVDYDSFLFPAWRLDEYASAAAREQLVGVPTPHPQGCTSISGVQYWVHFKSVSGTDYPIGPNGCAGMPPEASNIQQSLQPSNTTYAVTGKDGTGSTKFVVSTAESNASLGCSQTVPCSLVVIPIMGLSCDPAASALPPVDQPATYGVEDLAQARCSQVGNYSPGTFSPGDNSEAFAVSGLLWWSASNWRNRISVPLHFAPPGNLCSVANTSAPIDIYGSELFTQAAQQWGPNFCLNPKLFKFNLIQTSEPASKNLLRSHSVEAALQAAPPTTGFSSPVVQAPVGISGFAISYDIAGANGVHCQLKLDARLLAKLLTESYAGLSAVQVADTQIENNPLDLPADPEFQALNPDCKPAEAFDTAPASTLFTVSGSADVISALTSYINSDPEARAWLNGTPDPWGMVVNPAYKGIQLPVETWPLLDTFEGGGAYLSTVNQCLANNPVPILPLIAAPEPNMSLVSLNMQFGIAASDFACSNLAADPTLFPIGRELPDRVFLIGVTSLADASEFQLPAAALQTQVSATAPTKFTDASGRTFVAPSTSSLQAAASLLQPDQSSGTWLLPYADFHSDPAAATAYPGTMLLSADVPTQGLPPSDAKDFGDLLNFAAGSGQVPGSGNGQLPAGYLPLTAGNQLGNEVDYTLAAAYDVANQTGTVPPLVGATVPKGAGAHGNGSVGPNPTGGTGSTTNGGSSAGSGSKSASGATSGGAPGAGGSKSRGSTAYIQPAVASGRTLSVDPGLAGLALPLGLLVALIAGAAAGVVWWFRRRPGTT